MRTQFTVFTAPRTTKNERHLQLYAVKSMADIGGTG
jgi:hypothetical protein